MVRARGAQAGREPAASARAAAAERRCSLPCPRAPGTASAPGTERAQRREAPLGPGKRREIPRAAGRAGITTLRLRSGRVTQAGCRRGNPAPVPSNPPHLQPGVLRAGGENPHAITLGLCPVGWETRSKWSWHVLLPEKSLFLSCC